MEKLKNMTDCSKDKRIFAWYRYPEPSGKEYSEKDLENELVVIEIFDYCQILLAFISKYGWKKLIKFHGLEKLVEINKESGWFEEDSKEATDGIRYNCLITGYDPDSNSFGKYDVKTGFFTKE